MKQRKQKERRENRKRRPLSSLLGIKFEPLPVCDSFANPEAKKGETAVRFKDRKTQKEGDGWNIFFYIHRNKTIKIYILTS